MRERRVKAGVRRKRPPQWDERIRLVCKECAANSHGVSNVLPAAVCADRKQPRVEDVAGELVSRLYKDILHQGCVVFVGSGCTTEGRKWSHSRTFYEEIKEACAYPSDAESPSFPDLMEYFCQHMDGGRHNRLIREAVSRIERFCVPGEDQYGATIFGEELGYIPFFNRFVTTNWDPFLERSLEVLNPIVEDRDLAFWDDRKRQVLKIHGCITRPYSIVATKTDYETCMHRNHLVFNKLKDLMATKTFIFVGYSLKDSDFREVWAGITKRLGQFAKLAYAIDPNASDKDVEFWKERGIEIFGTFDLAFLRALRMKLEREKLVPSREFIALLQRQRMRIASVHVRLDQLSDGGFVTAMYQDGLLHAFDEILTSTRLGSRMEEFERDLADSEKAVTQMRQRRDLVEIAYWVGRREPLRIFCSRKNETVPLYFHPYRLEPVHKLVQGQSWKPYLRTVEKNQKRSRATTNGRRLHPHS